MPNTQNIKHDTVFPAVITSKRKICVVFVSSHNDSTKEITSHIVKGKAKIKIYSDYSKFKMTLFKRDLNKSVRNRSI